MDYTVIIFIIVVITTIEIGGVKRMSKPFISKSHVKADLWCEKTILNPLLLAGSADHHDVNAIEVVKTLQQMMLKANQ